MTRPTLRRIYPDSSGTSTRTIAFTRHRITLTEADAIWREDVMQRLEELVRLDCGWDGYGGLPVSLENATFALRMLEATCREDTPSPQIVPGSNGDLQIEWHTELGDVELLVRGPNNVRAWASLAGPDSDGEEIELTNDFIAVSRWVAEVTEPHIAFQAAA